MRIRFNYIAPLLVAGAAAAAIAAAPIAVADECDPTAAICQGPDVQGPDVQGPDVQNTGSSPSFAPAPDTDTGGAPGEMQLTEDPDRR
jgi:hypothetical protein